MAVNVFPDDPIVAEKERGWPDPPMQRCDICHQMEENTERVGEYTVCEYCMEDFLRSRDRKFVDGYLDENPDEKTSCIGMFYSRCSQKKNKNWYLRPCIT